MTLRISYLIEEPAISASTRLALAQADALTARGHRVRVVTDGPSVRWRSSRAEWIDVDGLTAYDAAVDDAVVAATDGATRVAQRIAGDRAVHLVHAIGDCVPELPETKLVVARSLVDACRRVSEKVVYVPPIVDEVLYRRRDAREHDPLRVLLAGASQNETHGIAEGYGAVAHARWFHQKLDLVRVSPWTPSRDEPLDSVQEFHIALTTDEMARLVHSCDLAVVPSHAEEGLSLVACEAMAAGVPLLLTSVPEHLSFDPVTDYALFAPERNAVDLGEALIELASDAALRARLRARGREVAGQWRAEAVAPRLEKFFTP